MDREKIYIHILKVEKEGKLRERGFEGRGRVGHFSWAAEADEPWLDAWKAAQGRLP